MHMQARLPRFRTHSRAATWSTPRGSSFMASRRTRSAARLSLSVSPQCPECYVTVMWPVARTCGVVCRVRSSSPITPSVRCNTSSDSPPPPTPTPNLPIPFPRLPRRGFRSHLLPASPLYYRRRFHPDCSPSALPMVLFCVAATPDATPDRDHDHAARCDVARRQIASLAWAW